MHESARRRDHSLARASSPRARPSNHRPAPTGSSRQLPRRCVEPSSCRPSVRPARRSSRRAPRRHRSRANAGRPSRRRPGCRRLRRERGRVRHPSLPASTRSCWMTFSGLLVASLAEMVVADRPARIDDVERRPVRVVERAPDRLLAVDSDGEVDPQPGGGRPDVVEILLEAELTGVDTDHDQPLALVLVGPGVHRVEACAAN